jgi:hypothetical protein
MALTISASVLKMAAMVDAILSVEGIDEVVVNINMQETLLATYTSPTFSSGGQTYTTMLRTTPDAPQAYEGCKTIPRVVKKVYMRRMIWSGLQVRPLCRWH